MYLSACKDSKSENQQIMEQTEQKTKQCQNLKQKETHN